MKKLFSLGLLTVCALVVAEQRAQAWVNGKLSLGFNWQVQSANNNILWGVFKNGQVPGPEAFGAPMPGGGHFGPGGGYMPPAAQQQFPYFGGMPGQQHPTAPAGYPQTLPQQQPSTVPTTGINNNQAAAYHYSPMQNVSYQQAYPMYYPYGSYGYSYQIPSYWYANR